MIVGLLVLVLNLVPNLELSPILEPRNSTIQCYTHLGCFTSKLLGNWSHAGIFF